MAIPVFAGYQLDVADRANQRRETMIYEYIACAVLMIGMTLFVMALAW